jgi:hypothetical protein
VGEELEEVIQFELTNVWKREPTKRDSILFTVFNFVPEALMLGRNFNKYGLVDWSGEEVLGL